MAATFLNSLSKDENTILTATKLIQTDFIYIIMCTRKLKIPKIKISTTHDHAEMQTIKDCLGGSNVNNC